MSALSDDFSGYVKAISLIFKSDDVTRVLNSLDDLVLTPGDLKKEESQLKRALELEGNEILREEEVTDKLTSDIRKLDHEYQCLEREILAVGVNIDEKRKEKIPCKEDEDTLKKTRKMLRLYKDITNLRWDYSAPENVIKGYVYGKSKMYIHPFEIPSDDKDAVDRVWQEIENASLKASFDTKGKENVNDNKKA
ncbi:uncharacterized protein LOC124166512 [Ischnura elegans]|uniref:uncharacterized protein LOC124166512 n=1 Tax=Ischnura elegans TaxID=197161 RepID=UPI001ED867EF|nr:uncharacterized protein LOC124166512 [Ischnura elegans]